MLAALAGARLAGSGPTGWWFSVRIPPGPGANQAAFYLGLAAVSVAWLGVARSLPSIRPGGLKALWLIAAAWCVPLLAGPVLFSHDVYSYLAQGETLHLGLNPYHNAPVVLGHLGRSDLLDAVSPFWRRSPAPYGPLFLKAASLIVAVTGSHLIAGVLALRIFDLAGVVLTAVFVPRLARALGADPLRATWLAVLSPLVLFELVGAGHNDALIVGLMVAGVTLAVTHRPLPAIVLCALAATIKLPGAIALAFVAAAWAWSSRDRVRVLAQSALVGSAAILAISVVAGTGLSWLSPSAVSTPQRVQLAITPATGVGWTIAAALRDLGLHVGSRHLESVMGSVALGLLVILTVALLWRTRIETLARDLGVVLVAATLCGPAAWPWYLTWGVALLAAVPGVQCSRALPAAVIVSSFLVKPNGIVALPLSSAPAVVTVYVALAVAAWGVRIRRRRADAARVAPHPLGEPARSTLVESR